MNARPHAAAGELLASLCALLGAQHVLTGDAVLPFAHDIFSARRMPLAVISPGSVDELQAAVRLAAAAGFALFPRGGGASYTDGYLPSQDNALIVDLRRLNRVVEINETDAYVTVETAVTWAALKSTLDAKGLRTPFRGPFSGLVATVGGAVAQHAISHGTGAHGGSAESVLSLDVVLADGSLLRTGSAGRGNVGTSSPFQRYFGPDLTGLFTGDCGAFGIKARVTLPLLPASTAFAGASFAFASFNSMHEGMRAAARAGLDDTHFALDAAMLRGQLKRGRGIKATLDIARSVLRNSPSLGYGLKQILGMAIAGEHALRQAPYLAHYIMEGADRREVGNDIQRLRRTMRTHAREIPNTVPAVVRADPFARMFHVVRPHGERWVPVHGVLPHSAVSAFHLALDGFYTARLDAMRQYGVWTGTMFEAVGRGAFLYEVGIYWPDELSPYHLETIDPRTLDGLQRHPPAPEARAWVSGFKSELIALFGQFGATHFQLGKVYPYSAVLSTTTLDGIRQIKRSLDPHSLMNPGALGLGFP